jgi:hypothetical protein
VCIYLNMLISTRVTGDCKSSQLTCELGTFPHKIAPLSPQQAIGKSDVCIIILILKIKYNVLLGTIAHESCVSHRPKKIH